MIRITDDLVIESQGATIPIERLAAAMQDRGEILIETCIDKNRLIGHSLIRAAAQLKKAVRDASVVAGAE